MVDFIFSHFDFLTFVVECGDNAELVREWLLTPNEKALKTLSTFVGAGDSIRKWVLGDDRSWPKLPPQIHDGYSSVFSRMPLIRKVREAASILGRNRAVVVRQIGGPMLPSKQLNDGDRREILFRLSTDHLYRPSQQFLNACLLAEKRTEDWTLSDVARKSARQVCALIGPFYLASARECIVGIGLGITVAFQLWGWGADRMALLVGASSLAGGLYGLKIYFLDAMPGEASHSYVRMARRAYRASPKLGAAERYELLYSILES
jgi:hypothetical protein